MGHSWWTVHVELLSVGRSHVGEVQEDCIPWEGPCAGAREQCEEEAVVEMKHEEMTATLVPHAS